MKGKLILIGFMGSGKTTVGLKLSRILKVPVEDTDKIIEKREHKPVSEIFAKEGEEYFREKETALLREISEEKGNIILSVGGGTPVREENRPLLKKCGKVVYLRVKPETVYKRLKGDTTRPLLDCENPLERIRTLLESRKQAYEESADLILDVDGLQSEEVAAEILEKLGG